MQDNLQRVIQDCEPENLSIQINNRFDKFNLIQQKPGTNYDLEHLNKGEAKFITCSADMTMFLQKINFMYDCFVEFLQQLMCLKECRLMRLPAQKKRMMKRKCKKQSNLRPKEPQHSQLM